MYTTSGRPATRHDREIVARHDVPIDNDLSGIIVFVGLDVEAVRSIIDGDVHEVLDLLSDRLASMVDDGEIDISREYRVMSTIRLTGTLEHTLEASSANDAEEKVRELIDCGEWEDPHSFLAYADIDDVTIEDVEEA
tara:strand:- start:51 stop:461 length:411 start_codon:yes stop_codon:yes gene_type:complete